MSLPFAGMKVGNEKIVALVGQAELDVKSASRGELALNFDGFYNFGADLVLDGSEIKRVAFTGIVNNGNTTGITLYESTDAVDIAAYYDEHNSVSGAFHGSTASVEASEATGDFILSKWDNSANSGVTFQGAFGVKNLMPGGGGGGGLVIDSLLFDPLDIPSADDKGPIDDAATAGQVAVAVSASVDIQDELKDSTNQGYALDSNYALSSTGSLSLLDISDSYREVFKLSNAEINQYEYTDPVDSNVTSSFVGATGIIEKTSYDGANPYTGATDPETGENSLNGETFVGDIETQAVLFVGQLDHSLFGWWSKKNYLTGELSNGERVVNAFIADGEEGVIFSSSNLASDGAYLVPAANAEFVGIALAEAHSMSKPFAGMEVGDEKIVALVGQAELTVTSATTGELALNFDDFYVFDAALKLDGSSIKEDSSKFTLVQESLSGNKTGITLYESTDAAAIAAHYDEHNSVRGDFQGARGASNASEAVGDFILSNSGVTFQGAFGVKER
jgi:hypothetical protein